MSSEPPDHIREARALWQQPQDKTQPQEQAQPQYGIMPAQPPQWVQPQYQGMPAVVAPKNPALAVILSLFIPGLGSMVNGRAGGGVTILLLYLLGVALSIILIGIPIAIGVWIWGMVDAHKAAQEWNRAHGIIS